MSTNLHQALFIVNKNGSLVYTKVFSPTMQTKLSTNDFIRLSSTFHSMHAISSQVIPDNCKTEPNPLQEEPNFEGINEIVTAAFTMKCMQTHTAVKVMLISSGDKIKE